MRNKNVFILLLNLAVLNSCKHDPVQINKDEPAKPVISVMLNTGQKNALEQDLSYETGRKILAVRMVRENKPAKTTLAGKYELKNNMLIFSPLHKLGEGLEFEAQYYFKKDTVRKRFSIPAISKPDNPLPEVEKIFPLSDKIPVNILIFHIRFNQEMSGDELAFKHVKIRDSKGEERLMPWRHKSHWLDSNRVLVMMIHPGRVKRGIDYKKEELGDLFKVGETYTIEVSPEIKNKYQQALSKTFIKSFTIVTADRKVPEIDIDKFKFPEANTKDPLILVFNEGMDYASITEEVQIIDADAKKIKGKMTYSNHDSVFYFIPEKAWKNAVYEIKFGKMVADFAHNRLDSPFEIQNLDEINSDVTSKKWEFIPK